MWRQRFAQDGWAVESGQYQRRTGGRLPDWFHKQPHTVRGDDFYLTGFHLLATERQFPGNGIGPIPWSKAFSYARSYGFDCRMSHFFARVILLLDGHYRDHLREEQKRESDREAKRQRREQKKSEGNVSRGPRSRRARPPRR